MATIEIVKMNDDLDPRVKNGVETFKFFNPRTGELMEIELGEQNAKHLENAMAKLDKYVDAGRLVVTPAPSKPKAAGNSSAAKGELALIREWAKTNGYTVGDRGRIKADIVEAYHKAQGKPFPVTQVVADTEAQASVALDGETVALDSEAPSGILCGLPEDLGTSHDGEKIIPCPDGKDGCEVMHTELTPEDQAEIDELLDEVTGETQEYTDEEIDAILAEIARDSE